MQKWREATRNQRLAAVAAAVLAVLAVMWVANVGPFSQSFAERVSSTVGADARCRTYGVNPVGKVYRCTYRTSTGIESRCFADEGGEVVTAYIEGC